MADRIRYAVSAIPVETIADDNEGQYDVIAGEIGKSFGGSGIALVDDFNLTAEYQGYKDATVNYHECIDSADDDNFSDETSASFVFIKNTGYEFDDATTLGDALDKSVKVMISSTGISLLDAGESIVLKDDSASINCVNINVRTVGTGGENNASSGHLAVEYLVGQRTIGA